MTDDAIDLRSDTVTTPTDEMREAAADAAVGDDVYREDPTVARLEERVADLLEFEDALFFPSGTMANQVAVRTHTEPGQEVLVDRDSHVYNWEVGGLVAHAEVQPRTFEGGERGVPGATAVRDAHVEESIHRAGTGLLCLENTHNGRGGLAIAPERIDEAARAAADRDVPTHLDGARLWNAAVAHDVAPARFTRHVASTMVSLSKGLGAPVGSMLAGDEAFVDAARRNRKLLGGAMRQVGIVAAPGLLALDAIDRIEDDHRAARRLADGLAGFDATGAVTCETNIVLVEVDEAAADAADFLERCAAAGIRGTTMADQIARFVTHRDVDGDDVDAALDRIESAVL